MTFREETISTEMLYKGAVLNLRKDKVTVKTGTSYREIIEHRGGSVIGALTDDGKLIMVKQFRKPMESVVMEVPAGKRDGDESPTEVAKRELKEETGYIAEEIIPLGAMYPSPGYTEEILYLFLARHLTPGETDFDENEAIDIYEYPLEELVEKVMKGEIKDGKSQLTILKINEYLRRESGERK